MRQLIPDEEGFSKDPGKRTINGICMCAHRGRIRAGHSDWMILGLLAPSAVRSPVSHRAA